MKGKIAPSLLDNAGTHSLSVPLLIGSNMPNNLFITYEVANHTESKERLDQAIQSFGNSTPLLSNAWYVNSPLSAEEAVRRLSNLLTEEDSLVIADTSNNESTWFNMPEKKARRIVQNWKM